MQKSLDRPCRETFSYGRRSLKPVLAACLITVSLLGGCEDEESRNQVAFSQAISDAAATVEQVRVNKANYGDEGFEANRTSLTSALGSISNMSAGADGQQFAGGMLAASIERELTAMALAEAEALERNARSDRSEVHGKVDALRRLSAATMHSRSVASMLSSDELDQVRRVRQQRIADLNSIIAELEGPIGDLADSNSQDRASVDALKEQANQLRARASEMGPSDGFTSLEEAVVQERQADKIEYAIANNEAASAYELEAPRTWAEAERAQFERMVKTIDSTRNDLDSLDSQLRGLATGLDGDISAMGTDISGSIDALNAQTNTIQPRYDAALQHAQSAAMKAQTASSKLRGADGKVAKLAQAQAEALQGSIHWTRARALGEHALLLNEILESGSALSNDSSLRSALEQTSSDIETSVAAAREAYTNAQTSLQSAGSNNDIIALSDSISLAMRALEGETIDLSSARMGSSGGSGYVASSEPGYESIDAFIAEAKAATEFDAPVIAHIVHSLRTDNTSTQRMLDAVDDGVAVFVELMTVLPQKFPDAPGLTEMMGGGMPMPGMDQIDQTEFEIVSATDTEAHITATAGGETNPIHLIMTDGRWMINLDAIMADMPEAPEITPESISMVNKVVKTFSSLLSQLKGDQFSTFEQFSNAAMGAVMGAMMEAGGGGSPFGGGGGSPFGGGS